MMLGLSDITGQCAAGLNPNYDDSGNLLSCTEGSANPPHCFAGETVTTFDDGSYGCAAQVTAQSIGVQVPNCNGGSPYLDPNGDWQCTAPPPPVTTTAPQSGSLGLFLVAAVVATFAYIYFTNSTARTYQQLSTGDIGGFLGVSK